MKNKKFLIIAAAVLLVAIIAAVVVIVASKLEAKEEEDKVYVNLVDKYASNGIKEYILVPERASAEGDCYEKTDGDIKAYEKFALTEDEAKKMNSLVANANWHLASSMEFSDPSTKAYWKDILNYSNISIDYDPATTYYLIRTSNGNFVSVSAFWPSTACEVALFDTETSAYYYIRFDN